MACLVFCPLGKWAQQETPLVLAYPTGLFSALQLLLLTGKTLTSIVAGSALVGVLNKESAIWVHSIVACVRLSDSFFR